ncbi:MAG: hypothetical protein OES14_00325 [Nitrosopumilus sp.]|jgi:hypothetical protein|nr:hypothetical protein [Nitrosopumilus sp.]MDH3824223.1 hypothetical protein [Nitrosopumilus sp.]
MTQEEKYKNFWKAMKIQTRLMRITVPLYRGKIFYTYDSTENKVSIYHPKEGVFFLSRLDFEKIDKKVRKLLKVDSSYDQFLLLPTTELCGFSIMRNYFNLQKRKNL